MLKKISPMFLLFFCRLFFVVLHGEEGKTFKRNTPPEKKDENRQKLYRYDELGNLLVYFYLLDLKNDKYLY
jgi:hypothetical protein